MEHLSAVFPEPTLSVAGGCPGNSSAEQAQALMPCSGTASLGSFPFSSTRPLPGHQRAVKPRGDGTDSHPQEGSECWGLLLGKGGVTSAVSVFS